jgi:hypothetical protein
MVHNNQGDIGTRNDFYNLVSVIYHALTGEQTYETSIRDAEEHGDHDLAVFLREVQQEDHKRADRAKQLLAQRVSQNTVR